MHKDVRCHEAQGWSGGSDGIRYLEVCGTLVEITQGAKYS